MADELGAKPLLAVWAGYTLNGTVVPQNQLAPYVADAINEIHFAVNPTTTTWGAMRAADGHPAPFELMGVEVGNEDFFDSSGSYNVYRYPMFYDAIKAAFANMPVVATATVTSRPMDILDEHFYNNTLADPTRIEPRTSSLGPLRTRFEYTFPANSVTVLELNSSFTPGASAASARPAVETEPPRSR